MGRPILTPAVLLACCAGLLATAPARAEIVATLPPAAHFTDVTVTATGAVWVSRAGPGPLASGLGTVAPGGVHWTTLPIAPPFSGTGEDRVLPRSDGGIWAYLGQRYLVRSTAGGALARTRVYLGQVDAFAVHPDGSLLAAGEGSVLRRFGVDGTITPIPFTPPGPLRKDGGACPLTGAAFTSDGSFWLVDDTCKRVIQRRADGSAVRLTVHAPGTTDPDAPTQVVAAAGGGVWVQADGFPDDVVVGIGGTTGARRIALSFDFSPGRMAVAPDGTLWVADAFKCRLLRIRDGTVERLPSPFPVDGLATAADGSLWLAGWSALAHETADSLATPSARCGERSPRLSFPDVTRRATVSLRALGRAHGLRVRSTETATLTGGADVEGAETGEVLQAVGPKGTVVRFGPSMLRRIARQVKRTGRADLDLNSLEVIDVDGNRPEHPSRQVTIVR
jgi:hypothetical protein